jgi:hypothetical protein
MESPSGNHDIPATHVVAGGKRMSLRDELHRRRYSVMDVDWAGGVPAQYSVVSLKRVGRDKSGRSERIVASCVTRTDTMLTVLRPLMRLWSARIAAGWRLSPRPTDAPQAHSSGLDPDRVLIFSAGVIEGLGVTSHQLALPGQLARRLSRITGRGTDVDIVIHRKGSLATATQALESRDLATYDAIVVTIGILDAMTLMSPRRWLASMASMLATISDASPSSTPIVVAGIPPLNSTRDFDSLLGKIARRHALRLNAITEQLCVDTDRVGFVSFPAPDRGYGTHSRSAQAYGYWASVIVQHLAPRLAGPTADQARANPNGNLRKSQLSSKWG